MKKIVFFLSLCFSVVWIGGCSSGYPKMIIRHSGPPRVVIDDILGATPPAEIYISNGTRFYLRTMVLDKYFDIDPDSSIRDSWRFEFYQSSLPALVHVFSDKERKNLVGVAEKVVLIGKAYVAHWKIEAGEIHFLDEKYRPKNYLVSSPRLEKARKVDVPTIKSELTTVVGFINLASEELLILEAGPMRSDLAKPGVPPEVYSFVGNRTKKIGPFGYTLFRVHIPTYDYDQYNQSVMYWVLGKKDNPIIVDVGPNWNQGPRVRQFLIR